eukprot:TRINITY_DN2960_c0_g2_i1.p1 TRINITY_DN2960_c0_g2~~TRINITY_DN2960_c0_g2_i1.p1  ORF type:complete len:408 (-),score=122.52 TRINITY_DN2960_c0_g2_i1:69-1292(-)
MPSRSRLKSRAAWPSLQRPDAPHVSSVAVRLGQAMLGRRPEKESGPAAAGKRKRKWDEGDDEEEVTGGEAEAGEDGAVAPPISEQELEEWRQKEKEEEKKEEEAKRNAVSQQAQVARPAQPVAGAPAVGGVNPTGLRMGEGNDAMRSADEVRIIRQMLEEEVVRFVADNRVDHAAGRDLRIEPVHIQLAVLDRGPLMGANNPSGALISRIRDAKRGIQGAVSRGAPPRGPGQLPPPPQQPQQPSLPLLQMQLQQPPQQPQQPPPGLNAVGGTPGLPPRQPGMPLITGPGGDIDRFCIENRVDQGAACSLRSESREVQEKVLTMGPLVNAVNPSAALMGRIKSIKMGGATGAPVQLSSIASMLQAPPAPGGAPGAPGAVAVAAKPALDAAGLNEAALKAIEAINSGKL